ncbi:MAG: hypothetical protein GY754_45030 [bacterium]|nr:hypothetical protein [bacterium]
MAHIETFTNNSLILEVNEDDTTIYIKWTGRSSDREPGSFIFPILSDAFNNASSYNKEIIMDFQEMEFMNSSTITPISRILEKCKQADNKMSIVYNQSKKWQDLSFAALKVFETNDKRIEITGK